MTQYDKEYMTVCFLLSGDPYKGAERTDCVRATMHKQALYHEVSNFWERWQVKHTHFMGQSAI